MSGCFFFFPKELEGLSFQAMQEAEIRRTAVPGQSGKRVHNTPILTEKS
jgi:hypothetical protein